MYVVQNYRFKEEVDELKPVSQLVHLYTAG